MNHEMKKTIAHGLHTVRHTETGKRLVHGAVSTAVVATGAVVGPAAAPVVVAGAVGYGLWRLLKS
jgi:hypothetical protein